MIHTVQPPLPLPLFPPKYSSRPAGCIAADIPLPPLPPQVFINTRWLYSTWRNFLAELCRTGGVIEASPGPAVRSSPSCNLFIEPDGKVRVTSTHEQILSSPYTFVGGAFPQTEVRAPTSLAPSI